MFLRYLSLYFDFFAKNLKASLEYRVDFILGVIAAIAYHGFSLMFIWIIFKNTTLIKGWGFYEVTFLYGLMATASDLFYLLFNNFWSFGMYVKQGRFDVYLTRPISALFHLIVDQLDRDAIPAMIIGFIIIITSISNLNIQMEIVDWIVLVVFIICGAAIIGAIQLISITANIWFINANSIAMAILNTHQLAFYPITIYNKAIRIILTIIVPFAFTSFYPANYFLDKGYRQLSFITPLVACVLWIIALQVWKFGINHYSSTGS